MKKQILIALFLLFSVASGKAQHLDIDLLRQINVENPSEDYDWRGITNSIEYVPAAYTVSNFTYGLIAHDKKALRYSFESTMSLVVSQATNTLIKIIVNRPRPSRRYPEYIETYSFKSTHSFPSGHTSVAFAAATTMAQQWHQVYFSFPIFAWSSSVGYSRMRLGKHYPSDVLVGAIVGVASGIFAHWATQRIVH